MRRNDLHGRRSEAGFTLIATGVCLVVLIGMLGLAVDLGRLYIAKNEAQAFADAGALAAVKQLNGKSTGITAATNYVTAMRDLNRWNMGTTAFSTNNTNLEFSASPAGPWAANPAPAGVTYARVTATPNLGLSFISMVGGPTTQAVSARSIAGVVEATFPKGGYLPYRIVAHTMRNDPNFGLTIGQEYTMRWPSNAKPGPNTCKGDNAQVWIDAAGAGGSSERGYFELQSAAEIRAAILGQRQLIPLSVGDILTMTNGNKITERSAMTALAARDTDLTNYQSTNGVAPNYYGNGSRLVILPISASATGDPHGSPVIHGDEVLAFGAFLIPTTYDNGGGNRSWCAIYMGAKTVGSSGVTPLPIAGAFVTRLLQ